MTIDPKQAWLELPVEASSSSPEALRARARRLRRRIAISNLIEYAAGLLLVLAALYSLTHPTHWLRAVADVTMIAAVSFVCWFLYRRRVVPEIPQGLNSLQYAVRIIEQLQRERDYLTQSWRWYLAPLAVPLTLHIAASTLHSVRNGLTLLESASALGAIVVTVAVFLAVRTYHKTAARRLQRGIDEMRVREDASQV